MSTKTKFTPFDGAKYLETEEDIALYLEDCLESGDPAVFRVALQTAARAKGMSAVAEAAGLGRQSLYKALSEEGNPQFDTVQRVLTALGVKIRLEAA